MWQELFKSPQALNFFWFPTFQREKYLAESDYLFFLLPSI